MKNHKALSLLLVTLLALLCIAGTKLSKMTKTTALQSTSRFYVVTQAANGTFHSRYMLAPDLATNLGPWITNVATGSDLSNLNAATNAHNSRIGVLETRADQAITNNHTAAVALKSGLTVDGVINSKSQARLDSLRVTNQADFNGPVVAGSTLAVSGTLGLTGLTQNELLYLAPGFGVANVTGVSPTEAGYLDGATSSIQTQLDGKQPLDSELTDWASYSTNVIASTAQVLINASSNALYAIETTRNAAVSNAAVAFAMTVSNEVAVLELTRNAAVSNALVTLSSNNVRVVAGTGGITVTPSGSGGVMTFTVNDDDAGGGTGSMTTLRTNAAVAGTNLTALLLTNANAASPVQFHASSNSGVATISAQIANLSGSGNIVASNAPTLYNLTMLGGLYGDTYKFENNTTNAGISRFEDDINQTFGTATLNALSVIGAGTVAGALDANTSVITPRLQVGSISNITHQVGDNWHLNGSSNWYSSEITSNTTAVVTNLQLNTPLFLTVSNRGSFTIAFDGVPAESWREFGGQAPVLAPNGITKFMFLREAVGQTNAYILSEPEAVLAPGQNLANSTNGTTITQSVLASMTNQAGIKFSMLAPAITVSNLTVNFGLTNYYLIRGCTNLVLTNLVELADSETANAVIHVHNTTGVTMGVVWPAHGAQHGYYFRTNALNDVRGLTSIAAGEYHVINLTAAFTNIFGSRTQW